MNPVTPEPLPGAAKIALVVKGILFVLGVLLLLLAAVSMWRGWGLLQGSRERAYLPVKLLAGQEFRTSFKTAAKAELGLELVLSRHEGVSDEVIDEVLSSETNALNIEWTVREGGTIVFSGRSTNAPKLFTFSNAAHTKGLGQFKPHRGGKYELVAKIHTDVPGMESARPQIIVRPNRAFAMSSSIAGSLGTFGGFVLGLIGFILILLARRERST